MVGPSIKRNDEACHGTNELYELHLTSAPESWVNLFPLASILLSLALHSLLVVL